MTSARTYCWLGLALAGFTALAVAFESTAVVTLVAPVVVLAADQLGDGPVVDLLGLTADVGSLSAGVAWLFHRASQDPADA